MVSIDVTCVTGTDVTPRRQSADAAARCGNVMWHDGTSSVTTAAGHTILLAQQYKYNVTALLQWEDYTKTVQCILEILHCCFLFKLYVH